MHILLLYATTEGQTRKIASFLSDHLSDTGHDTTLLRLADAPTVDLNRYDAAVLLASVHAGQYQPELLRFSKTHAATLDRRPHLFVSVSLSAAGDDPDDWQGLGACVDHLVETTGWTPQRVVHVAGAFRFTQYNWFKTWAMRWIAMQKGSPARTGEDLELTDWDALTRDVDAFVTGVAASQNRSS